MLLSRHRGGPHVRSRSGESMSALRRLRSSGLAPRLLSSQQHGYVYQLHNLLSPSDAEALYDYCKTDLPWQTEVDAFGEQGRPTTYFGDDNAIFSFVGLTLQPRAWPSQLAVARKAVGTIAAAHETSITACLANLYEESQGEIPWHHDEVRACGEARLVIALSLGGPRRMLLRRRDSLPAAAPISVPLPPGSAVVMASTAQEHWEHCLPLDVNEHDAPSRISLTFRSIEIGYEEGRPPPMPV